MQHDSCGRVLPGWMCCALRDSTGFSCNLWLSHFLLTPDTYKTFFFLHTSATHWIFFSSVNPVSLFNTSICQNALGCCQVIGCLRSSTIPNKVASERYAAGGGEKWEKNVMAIQTARGLDVYFFRCKTGPDKENKTSKRASEAR